MLFHINLKNICMHTHTKSRVRVSVCMCVCECTPWHMTRAQIFPSCDSQKLKLGHKVWQQMPLLAEPFHGPHTNILKEALWERN